MPTKMKLKAPYKQTNKQTLPPKKRNQKQNTKQTHLESILCLLTTLGHETCPGMWLIHPTTFHWRKLIFPFQAVIDCKPNLS